MKKILLILLIIGLYSSTAFADRGVAASKAIKAGFELERRGYTVREIPGTYLRQGRYRTYNRYLYGGNCYAIVGVGDNRVRDLDVIIWNRNWRRVARDNDSSDVTVASFCPRRSGTYRIRTKMYRGSGHFYQVIAYR